MTQRFLTQLLGLSRLLSIVIVIVTALFTASSLLAEELIETKQQRKERLQDYYIVDVIFFKHNESFADEEHAEQWPKNIEVSWPEEAYKISDDAITGVYPELAQDLDKLPESVQKALLYRSGEHGKASSQHLPQSGAFSQLNDEAKKIKSVKRYNLVKHQTWLQKISRGNDENHIVFTPFHEEIEQKNKSDEELTEKSLEFISGSLNITKSRYLHAHLNFWQIELLAPAEESKPTEDGLSFDAQSVDTLPIDAAALENPNTSPDQPETLEQELLADTEIEILEESWPNFSLEPFNSSELTSLPSYALEQESHTLISSEQIQQISGLKQKRRMRSSEIHYIDHPIMGVIIQITPLAKVLQTIENDQDE